MKLCFIGGYNPCYPRNSVLRKGFKRIGLEISEYRSPAGYKFWFRYPLLFFQARSCLWNHDFFLVPEFCQKDIPLAKFMAGLASTRVIFDPLASRYETKILDWKRKSPYSWTAWWNFKIDSWAFRLSDLILADTQAHKNYYCQTYGLSERKVEVLPLGYDNDLYKPQIEQHSQSETKTFEVLFFGSFLPLHGVETIIEAAKVVGDLDSSVRFRLIGSGQTLTRALALAAEWKLANVRFEGWQPQSVLPLKIGSAQICLGIFGQGEKVKRVIPHKIFQSLACRKAVITLRTPAAEEFFSHKKNIYFCSRPEAYQLAQAIIELKEDSGLREKIAANGYYLVKQNFSPEAVASNLLKILNNRFNLDRRRKFL